MKNKENEYFDDKELEDSGMEKFPVPRTMPSRWDVSELSPSKSESRRKPKDSSEIFEKFPKPRTMPMKWDTSELRK